jgi:uncharacterized protein DUF6600/FecR-like protein
MRAKMLVVLIASVVVRSATLQAIETPAARLLRVSLLEGDVTYQRTDLERWVDLSINTPILEGDKIWVGRGGRAEVEFENGSFARLSENTIVEFSRLGEIDSRNGVELQLIQGLGSFFVRPEGSFAVQTPLFSARLNDAASFRLDVETDGSSRLVVFDGKLEVAGPSTRLFVRKGELVRFLSQDADRYYLETNYVKDDWDRWNDERQDYLTKITQEQFLYGDRGWTTSDLYNYGSWYDDSTYGKIWRPASVADDWVPFREGRWIWCSPYGWSWVSYEPWGWIPYHYGRWANVYGHGWSWVPGPRYVSWCPGAVNWVQGPHWVGWVPLAPHEPWYGHGHGGLNVFASNNFRYRGSVTYLPNDSFVNGTPVRGFQTPRNPYTDGRIIAGPPRIPPTSASRMPVAGSPARRVFTNDDLEARRNMREGILNAGRVPGTPGLASGAEQTRHQRDALNAGPASSFTNRTPPVATTPGVRTIPRVAGSTQPPTRSRDSWNGDGSTGLAERNQRLYRLGSSDSSSQQPSAQRNPPSTWARPMAPPQVPSNSTSSPVPNPQDRFSARERVYEVYRERADSGRTDRYSPPQPVQRQSMSPRINTYSPPSPPPAITHPVGPPPSYNGPGVRPVGPPPTYQGSGSSRESFSRGQSGNSGGGAQEGRAAARGRSGR